MSKKKRFSCGFTTDTKTLKEHCDDIMNADIANEDKVAALIKVGLPPREAAMFVDIWRPATTTDAMPFAYTFGVEIECNVYHDSMRSHDDIVYQVEAYNHTDHREQDRHVFKFVHDSSLTGSCPTECVSPVLNDTDGFTALEAACQDLQDAGAYVNRSCGLHVHIGAQDLTEQEYCNVFVNYMYLQTAICRFMTPSRRTATWCRPLASYKGQLLACQTRQQVRYTLNSRYFCVNPVAYDAHKTLEFRQHSGSTNYDKISHWVRFCAALVGWSRGNRLDHDITEITDIPFLTDEEKTWFTNRAEYIAEHSI